MSQPSAGLKKWTYRCVLAAVLLSAGANLALIQTLRRSVNLNEAQMDIIERLTNAQDGLIEADTRLKKSLAELQVQVEICLDFKTRRARYDLTIQRSY